ncbi:hypothetical protein CRG98_030192 [Punica granatum]|uniref:ACT domain-containing protein ACR n=1 Tax=Punica granatum TaxID=22663 RepID=A0A2I0IZL6_PUNGR|nr:hypothetical protein CRG98_030192 [Punica granatum]
MEIVRILSSTTKDELAKCIRRFNLPRVTVDNDACSNATVIRVNSNKNHGILLEVVQVITDLNLIVKKAYIASDGGWFMDVFNVTDQHGNKIEDEVVLDYIRNVLVSESSIPVSTESTGLNPSTEHTTIELLGSDRPGLISDVSAVLTDLGCNIVNGEVWTHNTRAASLIQITDADTGSAISDPIRLSNLKELLNNLLNCNDESRNAKTMVCHEVRHPTRWLHQMMLNDRDYDCSDHDKLSDQDEEKRLPTVEIDKWRDNDYSVVIIRSKDRPKLLFDTVCTLIDMGYVVFHGNVDAEGPEAYQLMYGSSKEYYIRHRDGQPLKTDGERERLMKCLRAAIRRGVSEGLRLELCTADRVGLLSDVTRILREYGLTLTRAEVTTDGGKVANTFYVRNALGCPVDSRTIDSIRESIGKSELKVKGSPEDEIRPVAQESPTRFLSNCLLKSQSFSYFSLLRSYFLLGIGISRT